MKSLKLKVLVMFTIATSLLFFANCDNKFESSSSLEQESKVNIFEGLRTDVAKVTRLIYEECYDGEELDFIKIDSILQEYNFPTLMSYAKTRNAEANPLLIPSIDSIKSHLTENQIIIFDELLLFSEPTEEDFEELKTKCSSILDGEEFETMFLAIEATEAIYFGIQEGVFSSNLTRGADTASTFFCNLTTGGISTIWGAVAGGIVASTLVGGVVTLVAGAALSTIICG